MSSVAVNTAISFIIHTLDDLKGKGFSSLNHLIKMIETYQRKFKFDSDINHLFYILNELKSFKVQKEIINNIIKMTVYIFEDIINYLRTNHVEFLNKITIYALEIYSYFLDVYVKSYLKFNELKMIIQLLKEGKFEQVKEMLYDDYIVKMIVSMSITQEQTSKVVSFINEISSMFSREDIKDEIKSSSEILSRMSYRRHCDDQVDMSDPRIDSIIEKVHEDDRKETLKRILAKYGKTTRSDIDKTPPKSYPDSWEYSQENQAEI